MGILRYMPHKVLIHACACEHCENTGMAKGTHPHNLNLISVLHAKVAWSFIGTDARAVKPEAEPLRIDECLSA